jgi:hypothetical protein
MGVCALLLILLPPSYLCKCCCGMVGRGWSGVMCTAAASVAATAAAFRPLHLGAAAGVLRWGVCTVAATAAAFRPLQYAAVAACLSGGMHTAADTTAAFRTLQYAAAAGGVGVGGVHCCCFCYSLQVVALYCCRRVLHRGCAHCCCFCCCCCSYSWSDGLLNYACSCLGRCLAWQVPANC